MCRSRGGGRSGHHHLGQPACRPGAIQCTLAQLPVGMGVLPAKFLSLRGNSPPILLLLGLFKPRTSQYAQLHLKKFMILLILFAALFIVAVAIVVRNENKQP
jgi:hypothetical protein